MEAIKTTINDLTPTSSETGMRRSSQELTRKSNSELNAGEILGDIYDRFYRQAGWNLLSDEERDFRIAAGLEVLGASDVPPKYYEELYRRAMDTRTRRKAEGETVFVLSAEDLAVEWHGFKNELANQDREKSPETCSNRANHNEEILVEYGLPGATNWLPCHECRSTAFRQRSAEVESTKATPKRLIGEVQKQAESSVSLVSRILKILDRAMIDELDNAEEYKKVYDGRKFWNRVFNLVGKFDQEWGEWQKAKVEK